MSELKNTSLIKQHLGFTLLICQLYQFKTEKMVYLFEWEDDEDTMIYMQKYILSILNESLYCSTQRQEI